jgi:release factor glutamine methyltransferase
MKNTLVQFFGRPIRAGVQWYLSKPRDFKYRDINITVSPGVFHPGFFFSTQLILEFLATQGLKGKKFLELGSGSGLISIYASKKGADVTATDINKKAVKNTTVNSVKNQVKITAIESDLFDNIPVAAFEWIVINPPYYPVNPKTEEEHAWNCGEHHQYFERLFASIAKYVNSNSKILMILSDVCDLHKIFSIADANGFSFEKIMERKVWADGRNYLYWVKRT